MTIYFFIYSYALFPVLFLSFDIRILLLFNQSLLLSLTIFGRQVDVVIKKQKTKNDDLIFFFFFGSSSFFLLFLGMNVSHFRQMNL